MARLAQNSLTLFRHPSLSAIAPGRSTRLHPVSAQRCCMKILPDRAAFARPYEGVHRSISHQEFLPASPAVYRMSGSSNLDSFCDWW